MAPAYASFSSTQTRHPEMDTSRSFTVFPQLPPEIRSIIWCHALTPQIVKWSRIDGKNVFTAPSESFPLYSVCQESRDVAMLYGEYRDISTDSTPLYFSPLIDYLFFDAGWIDLVRSNHPPALMLNLNHTPPLILNQLNPTPSRDVDPLDEILPDFADIQRVMIHPNFSDDRKRPRTLFEKLPKLEQLLIGADEKSMGVQNKFLLSTVYDAKMYYEARVKKKNPQAKVPQIAIGCLGWRGAERMSMHHGTEDKRQLVGIFSMQHEMTRHLQRVREEERRFLEDSFRMKRPKLTLKLRPAQKKDESAQKDDEMDLSPAEETNADVDVDMDVNMDGDVEMDIEEQPPSYSSVNEQRRSDGHSGQLGDAAVASSQAINERVSTRPGTWGNKILRGQILSLGNSSTVIVKGM